MRGITTIESLERRTLLSAAAGDVASRMLAADLNGDATDELIVIKDRDIQVWTVNNGVRDAVTPFGTLPADMRVVDTGDLNGDGTDDLLLESADNTLSAWLVNNLQPSVLTTISTPHYAKLNHLVGLADLNGDGTDDVVRGGEQINVSLLTNAAVVGLSRVGFVGSKDKIQVQVADMDSDGDDDFVFANHVTGDVGFWRIRDNQAAKYIYLGKADLDNWDWVATPTAGGRGQIVFYNKASGAVGAWTRANGVTTYNTIGTLSQGDWRFVAAADLNGDSSQDLVWQDNQTGEMVTWFMSRGASTGSTWLLRGPAEQYNPAAEPDMGISYVRFRTPVAQGQQITGEATISWSEFPQNAVLEISNGAGVVTTQTLVEHPNPYSFEITAPAEAGTYTLEAKLTFGPYGRTSIARQEVLVYDPADPSVPADLRVTVVDGLADGYKTADRITLDVRVDNIGILPGAATYEFRASQNSVWGDGDDYVLTLDPVSVGYGSSWKTAEAPDLSGDYYIMVSAEGSATDHPWVSPSPVAFTSVPAADLVITDASYQAGTYQYGTVIATTVRITNQSDVDLPEGTEVRLKTSLPLADEFAWNVYGSTSISYTGGIAAGQTITLEKQVSLSGEWMKQRLGGNRQILFAVEVVGMPEYFANNYWARGDADLVIESRPTLYSADFNGDGIQDLLAGRSNGQWEIWLKQSDGTFQKNIIDPLQYIPQFGDFNGDGTDDLLFGNLNGPYQIWIVKDGRIVQKNQLGPGTYFRGIGDVNGDGTDDLVWSLGGGWTGAWIMNDGVAERWQTIGLADYDRWHVATLADVDGDGDDDILWAENTSTWTLGAWLIDGESIRWTALAEGLNGSVVRTGDFDGNGRTDLLIGHGGSSYTAWMSSPSGGNWVVLGTETGGWLIGVGDVDGDHVDDLLFQNSIGVFAWIMSGGKVTQRQTIYSA